MNDIYERAARYGVNLVGDQGYDYRVNHDLGYYQLREIAELGGRIIKTRLLMDRPADGGRADISYVHAELPDGSIVAVDPSEVWGMTRWNFKSKLVEWARSQGVYAKGIGLLDAISYAD